MKTILVLYASREGHTRQIAGRLAESLRAGGRAAQAIDLREGAQKVDLAETAAVVLAASVHTGHFEKEMVRFVREHREALDALPNAFLAVSLSQAGVQRADATPEEHARFVADVRKLDEQFFRDTGWQPREIHDVAGKLAYSQYNWLIRQVMKRIARASGGSTDTSRDHDYTDWQDLEAFAHRFGASVPPA